MRQKRLIGAALAIAALAVAPWVWGTWAEYQLSSELARLHAAGEPVSAADLPADTLADDANASLDYAAAGKLVDDTRPAWVAWGKVDSGVGPPTDAERDVLARLVVDNAAAVARVAVARGKVAGPWHDPFIRPTIFTSKQFDLGSERRLATLLVLAAWSAQLQGDGATAVARASDLCRLSDAAEWRPFVVGHLVAAGMWSRAARTVERVAPALTIGGPGGTDRAAVERLIARLLDGRAAADGDRSLGEPSGS